MSAGNKKWFTFAVPPLEAMEAWVEEDAVTAFPLGVVEVENLSRVIMRPMPDGKLAIVGVQKIAEKTLFNGGLCLLPPIPAEGSKIEALSQAWGTIAVARSMPENGALPTKPRLHLT